MAAQVNQDAQPSHLTRAYALNNPEEARKLYDEWAATYNSDLAKDSQDYVAPEIASQCILKQCGTKTLSEDLTILDAGCGTGLVGVHLAKLGAKKVDGIDVSPGMVDIARSAGVYRMLETADLSQPLVYKDKSYDVVVCIGTLTQGHVGPGALTEFIRIVKKDGLIVATVLEAIWESGGYKQAIDDLIAGGQVKLVSAEPEEYRRGAGVKAKMVILRVV